MLSLSLFALLFSVPAVFAHPFHEDGGLEIRASPATDLQAIFDGNKRYRSKHRPSTLKKLAEGQAPPFLYLGCADSRTSETAIFDAKPGKVFTHRNIANQFNTNDTTAYAVLSYGVAALGVQHVIVMGHYGCGGVAAAIATAPKVEKDSAMDVVLGSITSIRALYQSSSRKEIAEHREKNKGKEIKEPKYQDAVFKALVEENVKAGVERVANSNVIKQHWESLSKKSKRAAKKAAQDVFVHGMVVDIETGNVFDLGVSVGPPGKEIPKNPFSKVPGAESEKKGKTDKKEKKD